jgi:hypothetical protein
VWDGEHIGKCIHAATLAWAYTGNTELRTKLDHAVAELLKCQLEDGYLGTQVFHITSAGKSWGLAPFATAGCDGSAYRVWLQVADAASGRNLLENGTESRSRKGSLHGSILEGDCVFTSDGKMAEEDWYAVTLPKPVTIGTLTFVQGYAFYGHPFRLGGGSIPPGANRKSSSKPNRTASGKRRENLPLIPTRRPAIRVNSGVLKTTALPSARRSRPSPSVSSASPRPAIIPIVGLSPPAPASRRSPRNRKDIKPFSINLKPLLQTVNSKT